jgi:hypothetical protein
MIAFKYHKGNKIYLYSLLKAYYFNIWYRESEFANSFTEKIMNLLTILKDFYQNTASNL